MDESFRVLEAELARVRDGAFDSWKTYMSYYTWFFGANIIVLGWVLSTPSATPPDAANVRILAAVWILFNLAGVASTLLLRSFCVDVANKTERVCHLMKQKLASMQLAGSVTSGFPSRLSSWGSTANAFGLAVNVVLVIRIR